MAYVAVKGVITAVGRKKLCRAHAGDIILPPITHMAWGKGGVDETQNPILTTGNEIALYNQLLMKEIESHVYTVDGETTCKYTATIGKNELPGEYISEIGLFDSEGDLIAFQTFLVKGKDSGIPVSYAVEEIF